MSLQPELPGVGQRSRYGLLAHDGVWALILLAVGCLIYLPRLGSFPLWDPWEPHYTQVAWEMQQRLTWVNPWYRGTDNWWSKPILMLWMLRASLGVLWDHMGDFGNHELAARLPFALTAISGGLLHFDWVRRLFGRTTGVLAGLILITSPQYLLVGRQVMADEPFLVAYTAAMGYLAVGFFTPRPAAPIRLTTPDPNTPSTRRHKARAIVFWVLLATSTVVSGWAAAIIAALVFVIFAVATYRPGDYAGFLGNRTVASYALRRGAMAGIIVVVAVVIALDTPGNARWVRFLIIDIAVLAIVLGVFFDLPPTRHAWRTLKRVRGHLGVPACVLAVLLSSAALTLIDTLPQYVSRSWLLDTSWLSQPIVWRLAVDLSSNAPAGVQWLFQPVLWAVLPFVALVGYHRGQWRVSPWLTAHWPFVAFWVLQAISVLAKGFVGPTLAVLVLTGYWLATFRWRDYGLSHERRRWLHYLLVRGAIALAILVAAGLLAYYIPAVRREQRQLYQGLILAAAAITIGLGVFCDLPPARHALRLLRRMHAGWGLLLFFAVAAPWFVYMTFEHGWPYWREWIFYHHLGRAAGTIDKPGGTFDFFVKQVAFSGFPWTAFGLGALWMFLGRSSAARSIAERRNLYVLLATLLPFMFFALSGTKFAHYVMPVLPMLGVMLAATLSWLGKREEHPPLAELRPALGNNVPAYAGDNTPWHRRLGARGDMLVVAAVALVGFGILAHDLALDFRHLLRLFLYYYNRETPLDYQPFVILQVIFFPMGIVIGLLLFVRWIGRSHLVVLSSLAVVFACYLSWITMPAMKDTYSFKPFYTAYEKLAKPGEPIGQYNDWQQPVRSVIFLFKNRCHHLRSDRQATAFLERPGRKFILVDRNRLADLRRVAKKAGVQLYVVFDGHPYGRMVSNQPNETDTRKAAAHILRELPEGIYRIDANFENKIRLLGWRVTPPEVEAGGSVEVELYYQCDATMRRDWQIFIHGDGPRGSSHRIHVDHFPLDGLYPTNEWQPTEIIRDTFTVHVPGDYPYDYLHLWNGWYIGNQRLELVNNPPNDGQNRVRGPRIDVRRD